MQSPQLDAPPSHMISSRWLSLSDDLLVLLLRRLHLPDYVRFGAVCRSWNTIFSSKPCPPLPHLPWFVLPDQPSSSTSRFLSFYCPSDSRVYNFPSLHEINNNGHDLLFTPCAGSFNGWLMVSTDSLPDNRLFLYNPISGGRVELSPPCMRLPSKTIFVPATDDHSPYIVAYFELAGAIGTCMLSEGKQQGWTWFVHENFPEFKYEDIIMYRGSLYSLIDTGELRLINFYPSHEGIAPPHIQTVVGPVFNSPLPPGTRILLVECKGDFLLVSISPQESDIMELFKANLRIGRWEVPGYAEKCTYFAGDNWMFWKYLYNEKRLNPAKYICGGYLARVCTWLVPELS